MRSIPYSRFTREYYKNLTPEKRSAIKRDDNYRRLYNITLDDYNQMFADQKGCCCICKRHQSEIMTILHVDHSHKTGKVRGLLCQKCNASLGWFENNQEEILKYLSIKV